MEKKEKLGSKMPPQLKNILRAANGLGQNKTKPSHDHYRDDEVFFELISPEAYDVYEKKARYSRPSNCRHCWANGSVGKYSFGIPEIHRLKMER